jgi:Kef-type K+ transport system membrane component KefB
MVFLSTIGLVYLMFSAGLEVDINQFMRVRGRAVVFGFFTFLTPQLMGMGLGRILGLNWLGSILLGSAFASHTLIAFPILTRLGVTRNEASR